MTAFVDVRVKHADLWKMVLGQLSGWGLHRIEMRPPSSGPEAELTFGPYEAPDREDVLRARGVDILASRTREEGS